jgi:hypothetical protein
MDEALLDLIIEVAYDRDLVSKKRKQLRERLSVELALAALSVSELYLRSQEASSSYNILVEECTKYALEDDEPKSNCFPGSLEELFTTLCDSPPNSLRTNKR